VSICAELRPNPRFDVLRSRSCRLPRSSATTLARSRHNYGSRPALAECESWAQNCFMERTMLPRFCGNHLGNAVSSRHIEGGRTPRESLTMPRPSTVMAAPFAASALRRVVAACVAAVPVLVTSVSYAQSVQTPGAGAPVSGNGWQNSAPVDPATLSCNALKAKLQTAGELSILSGPKGGWADTYYGPAVPRCQFWQMPVFSYVRAGDGLCGVGYICVDKLSID